MTVPCYLTLLYTKDEKTLGTCHFQTVWNDNYVFQNCINEYLKWNTKHSIMYIVKWNIIHNIMYIVYTTFECTVMNRPHTAVQQLADPLYE